VAAAFEDAMVAAAPLMITPEQEANWRADPDSISDLPKGSDVGSLLGGDQDVWLASCGGFYASPYGAAGSPCPTPFWGCLDGPSGTMN
jgi:hypothetical protein